MKTLSLLLPYVIVFRQKKWIHNSEIAVDFRGRYLKQVKATFTHRNVINVFIVYELDTWSVTLGDWFFGR